MGRSRGTAGLQRAGGRPGDLVVVCPDSGFVKTARAYARRLKAPLAIADKRRVDHSERAEVLDLVGDVGGLNALLVGDFVIVRGHEAPMTTAWS